MNIFTARKPSCGKVMFLHLSVSHSVHRGCVYPSTQRVGVCIPVCNGERVLPLGPGVYTPPGQTPSGQTPCWADTPSGHTHPLGRHPPYTHPPDGPLSRQCASYWNAFLFDRLCVLHKVTEVYPPLTSPIRTHSHRAKAKMKAKIFFDV